MSGSSGSMPRNFEQQRKQAKDLLKAVRAGEPDALARLKAYRIDAQACQLADAQLVIAREAGFDSWPKLVEHFGEKATQEFMAAVHTGNVVELRRLLHGSARLRKKVNEPLFSFGTRAVHAAGGHVDVIDVLLEFGADINLRSDWKEGPFTVLETCPEEQARALIARGARLTAHAAARFGWLDELRQIVEAHPAVVHEKGGDGQRPLHFAKTVAIADYLLDHGAAIDAKCDDHQSTAAQYALKDRPDVTRRLLERGATADIFMAARLGDVTFAERLIRENPDCLAARVRVPGYAPVHPFGIYLWTLGQFVSPHEVALAFGHKDVHALLASHSSPKLLFLDAAMRGDEPAARAAMASDATLPRSLSRHEHGLLAFAAFNHRVASFQLMLALGFDPAAPGIDGGSALHGAAWVGNIGMVEALLARGGVDLNALDPTHGSPPLGWAAFGSVHCRHPHGDYAGVIERLVHAGADVKMAGNKFGHSMAGMAEGRPEIEALLRKLGAA